MTTGTETTWGGSLHSSLRIFPPAPYLVPYLSSHGLLPQQVLARLPFDKSRSNDPTKAMPDDKRRREVRHLCEWAGLAYEQADGRLSVTELGAAVLRWCSVPAGQSSPLINEHNRLILGRHAAYALAACQLRNPTGAGKKYAPSMVVFPFAFIWRVMLASGGRLSSDELNRAVLRIRSASDIAECVRLIAESRKAAEAGDLDAANIMGAETLTETGKNDRLIAWIAMAAFGWVLVRDKRETGTDFYEIRPGAASILRSAASIAYRHRDFADEPEYVEFISDMAALPRDLR